MIDAGELWHVLQTLPRQEKALARDLSAHSIEHYLPLNPSIRYYGRRKAKFEVPLFPGYLFLRGTLDTAYRADRTGRVARIIPVADQKQLENELAQIRKALESGAALSPCQQFRPGMPVTVRCGPFEGLRGEVEVAHRPDRLILKVRTLGQAVSLDIEAGLLEPMERALAA